MIENRIDIYGDNRFPEHSKVREACRGIVIRDGLILLTYEVNTDQWFIPGGGLEGNETIHTPKEVISREPGKVGSYCSPSRESLGLCR